MEQQNKSKGTIVLIIILVIVTIAAIVTATLAYAQYTSSFSGNATATVAKWNVTLNTSANKNEIQANYEHVYEGKIAPGTSGSFEIAINTNDTEVDVKYAVILNGMVTNPEGNSIKHLKFFSDEEHTDEVVLGEENHNLVGIIKSPKTNTENKDATVRIYWYWPFDYAEASSEKNQKAYGDLIEEYNLEAAKVAEEGNVINYAKELYDEEDTKVSNEISSMTINYTVKAWQIEPDDADDFILE